MKKLMLVATLLAAGASVPFAQDTMDNNDYNSNNSAYSYGNHNGGNHMNGMGKGHMMNGGNRMGKGHMNGMGGNHMNSDRDDRGHGNRNGGRHGNRMSGHMKGGDCCGRGSSYSSQMPVAVQQQIQTIEQKYEVQRLAIDQKYDTQNITFRAQYDKLYNSISDEDMNSMNNATLTPVQAQFLLQMDALDDQRNQVREEKRNEVRTLENQASDAIDSVTKKWLSSIK